MEGGEEGCEGGAEFVRHVDQKVKLEVVDFLYLLIGILQCLQHSVNGIGQAANFIGVPPRRETTGVVFRDRNLGGSGSQGLKGKHCPVHQQPDHQSCQSECHDDPRIEKGTQLV